MIVYKFSNQKLIVPMKIKFSEVTFADSRRCWSRDHGAVLIKGTLYRCGRPGVAAVHISERESASSFQ